MEILPSIHKPSRTASSAIPTTAFSSVLDPSVSSLLCKHPELQLGSQSPIHVERATHLKLLGIQSLPSEKVHSIGHVEHTAIPGPHGTIPIRILYPSHGEIFRRGSTAGALIYMHGGGWSVGSIDEWENGLRALSEGSSVQIYLVEYHLSPEAQHPVQLDEYDAVIDAVQGSFGSSRGVSRVLGGGDSVGANMTTAISLRRKDQNKKPLDGQVLFYPYSRLPFDTPAAVECRTGYYLEANGLLAFAHRHLPRDVAPSDRYVSPGMQSVEDLKELPPAVVYTSGFDPLRDVGVEMASKLEKAGNKVLWRHYENLTHSYLQMTPWSDAAKDAVDEAAADVNRMAYGSLLDYVEDELSV